MDVSVTPFGEALCACFRGSLVVEIAEALEVVEGLPAVVSGEPALLQARVELRAGAIRGAQRAERYVLCSWLSP